MRKLYALGTLTLLALLAFGSTAYACNGGGKSAGAGCGDKVLSSNAKSGCSTELSGCSSKEQADSDFFLNSYLHVKGGLEKGCCISTESAVQAWKAGLESMKIESQQAELTKLAAILDSWPKEIQAQRERFQDLSTWTISYVEQHPDRCKGAEIITCKVSGHRWVQTAESAGNPYSG